MLAITYSSTMELVTNTRFTLFMGTLAVVVGQPHYQVLLQQPLKFLNVVNRDNRLADGSCCATSEVPPCTISCGDIRIDLCFREVGHPSTDTNISNCPLGGMPFTSEMGSFPSIPEQVAFKSSEHATTTSYPGSLEMRFRMSAIQLESLIDEGQVTVSNPIRDSYFPDRYPNFNRVYGHGENHIAFIMIFIAITCKETYTGSNCGVEVCVPRDDATGHFNCNANQNKVCLPGYDNPDTNCVDKIVTKYSTTTCDESTSTIANSETMCCASTIPSVTSNFKSASSPVQSVSSDIKSASSHTVSLASTPVTHHSLPLLNSMSTVAGGVVRATSISSHSVGTPMSLHSPSPSAVVSTIAGAVTMVTSNHGFHSVTTSVSTHSPPSSDVASIIAGGVCGGVALLLLLVLFNVVLVLAIIKIKRRNLANMQIFEANLVHNAEREILLDNVENNQGMNAGEINNDSSDDSSVSSENDNPEEVLYL